MKQITRIHIAGFRSLVDVTLEPGPLTVLIGPNGAGKSNLLTFFRMLSNIRSQSLRSFVARQGGASTLIHRGTGGVREILWRIEASDELGKIAYAGGLAYTGADQLVFIDEYVEGQTPEMSDWRKVALQGWGSESSLENSEVAWPRGMPSLARWVLGQISYFHLRDTSATAPICSNARAVDHHFLHPDGSNLAAYLLARKQSPSEDGRAAWRMFEGLIRRIAPYIKSLEPTPHVEDPAQFRFYDPDVRLDRISVHLDWIDENDNRFGVSQLSDGMLRAIALFAALTHPADRLPGFIIIDEPELGLHPAALALLIDWIRSISSRCKVVLATQSPALLNLVEPEEVVVVERVRGATQLRRLDLDSLQEWLEDFSLAELYDKNVLGGRP